MTVIEAATPRIAATPAAATSALARIEAVRMLRHPAPWAGLVLSVGWAIDALDEAWSGAAYTGLVAAGTPLLLGISIASVSVFARERVPIADEAPLSAPRRSAARLLAGLGLVALMAVVVTACAVWLKLSGGLALGDEPGRTASAQYGLPELLQPVLLAAFAVVSGAAVVHLVKHRLTAWIVLTVGWFMAGAAYWVFNGSAARMFTPLQVQPVYLNIGPGSLSPDAFPQDWLLSEPGTYQDHWARIVVSDALAAWHDVYLLALIGLFAAIALGGRTGRRIALAALVLGAVAVVGQQVSTPRADAVAVDSLPPAPAKDATAIPVVVDTDLGGDDLMALAFLLRHPGVDVKAITVPSTGLVGCEPGVDLVGDLFTGLGAAPVPVACGDGEATGEARVMPEEWRQVASAGTGLPRADTTLTAGATSSAELIAGLAGTVEGLHVVALGPLTDVAKVARQSPDAYRRLAGVHVMGGSVAGPLVDGVAEWNAAADPGSLADVLAAAGNADGPKLTIVPEDAVPSGTPDVLFAPVIGDVAAVAAIPKWWDLSTAAALVSPGGAVECGAWVHDPSEPGRLRKTGSGRVCVAVALDAAALEQDYARAFSSN